MDDHKCEEFVCMCAGYPECHLCSRRMPDGSALYQHENKN